VIATGSTTATAIDAATATSSEIATAIEGFMRKP
jgi:hypothetical protein